MQVVRLPTADGEEIDAWFDIPSGPGPHSGIVLAHGIGGIKSAGLRPFHDHFAALGFATLTFDYRHWGASSGEPREWLHLDRQRQDYRTALAWLRGQDGVDPDDVFMWGTSFAGMHVVRLAAEDHRLRGAIAQCPLVDGLAGVLNMPPLQSLRITAAALADRRAAARGEARRYLPLSVEPGQFGVISTTDAMRGLQLLAPTDGQDWPNRITAGSLLDATFSRPVRRASRIRCPILMVVAQDDTMAPTAPAVRVAARAPRGELYRSAGGHYDVYAGGLDHHNVLRVETEFLQRHRRQG